MAVTYAWRLDANKYAYIVSPDGDYGHVSESPLAGSELNTVAEKANQLFGESPNSKGLDGYIEAFNAMLTKVEQRWKEITQFYDILSADVYYSVDSADYADLRGVGIKGVKYIGSIKSDGKGIDSTKSLVIGTDIKPGCSGYADMYGIYMNDTIANENTWENILNKNIVPENVFFVYNGSNGSNGSDANTSELQNKINELQNKINEMQNKINALETSITGLTQTVTEHAQQINELDSEINGIEDRVADLEQNPPSSEPTVGESVKIEDMVNGSDGFVVCANDTTLYRTKVKIDADGNIKSLTTVEAEHYYKIPENE